MARTQLAVAAALLALASPAGAQVPRHLDPGFLESIEDAQLHGTVTPPGADSHHATAEIAAYDDLVQGYPKLTDQQLRTRYFKQRLFGPLGELDREYSPREGVTVYRDSRWGEPHIYGRTDTDMAFGAGYVAAEDRLAIMELLRALGRAEAFQLIGTAPSWLADAEVARLYGYTEEEFQAMIDRLPARYGQPGRDMVAILDAYVAGINEYIASAQKGEAGLPAGFAELGLGAPEYWKTTDVVAAVSTVRALFGAGGGSELSNAAVLAELVGDYGAQKGRAIYEDFRSRDNADGPVHTTRPFPYLQRDEAKIDPRSTAVEPGSAATMARLARKSRIRYERLKLSTPLGAIDLSHPGSTSNHLVVGASRSASGHPILIGGPQAGYFSPQILMDYELHSPTIHARGAGFPGLSALVVMGRTQNYSWTPTAGGSDMIDTYVEKLCDPAGGSPTEDSRYYEFKGKCLPMDRRVLREARTLPGGELVPEIVVERTVHGPVVARDTLGGRPVAVASKRSTYMKELDPAISILKMNRNQARTGDDFVDIFAESHNLSTNWSYANDEEIAYVHGGLYPRRPENVDPDLPVWGTGEWEWATDEQGNDIYLGRREVPHEVAPARDFFVSWNNRPAPHWNASDAQWGWSSVYRADLLEDAILAERPGTIDPVRLVQMMERAGLTDLRGRYVAPLALRVLERAPGLGARERQMIDLLRRWVDDGALRRDGNGDGAYDHSAAVAIMDAWWERLIRAVYDPVIEDAGRIPIGFDNAPGPTGSAYQDGFYGYLWTDLSMALGDRVKSPTSQVYCGGSASASGTLDECARRVLASLVAAGDALAADQGNDPGAWGADAEGERIRFLPGAAFSMHWVNRPTTQQIAMFGARTPACERASAYRRAGARPSGRGLRFRLRPRTLSPVTVEVRRQSAGRRIGRQRRVARFRGRHAGFRWAARARLRPGYYAVSFRSRARDGSTHIRRVAVRRGRGRFRRAPALERGKPCGLVRHFALRRSVFGGAGRGRPLVVALRLGEARRASVVVRRRGRAVKRFRARTYAAGRTHTLRLSPRGLRRGRYRITLRVAGRRQKLAARRL